MKEESVALIVTDNSNYDNAKLLKLMMYYWCLAEGSCWVGGYEDNGEITSEERLYLEKLYEEVRWKSQNDYNNHYDDSNDDDSSSEELVTSSTSTEDEVKEE